MARSRAIPRNFNNQTWRIDFSRVEWLVDIIDGKYRKIPREMRPEDNWVWSPQGVIDMHRPATWRQATDESRTQCDESLRKAPRSRCPQRGSPENSSSNAHAANLHPGLPQIKPQPGFLARVRPPPVKERFNEKFGMTKIFAAPSLEMSQCPAANHLRQAQEDPVQSHRCPAVELWLNLRL